jgi:Protein of unknown function (DUF3579)
MHAALQHSPGKMPASGTVPAWAEPVPRAASALHPQVMTLSKTRYFHIQGLTLEGKTFRPSDWSERLAGAMSCFRPGGVQGGIGAYIGYSPFCVPRVVDGIKCVIVSEELRDIEPMAWDFVMNFARDNNLKLVEVHPVAVAAVLPPVAAQ